MMEVILADVGRWIQELRKGVGLSQEELAEKADISKQTVSKIETGKREILASNIAKLAYALDISTDYLLFGTHTMEDLKRLDCKLLTLTEPQYKYVESMINSFVDYCNDS
jgi:transcriptional regulator with XRE-family HTH domain